MDWTQIDIFTTTEGIEPVGAALLELNIGGYTVQDAEDFAQFLEGKSGHWDYIDDELMQLRDTETKLTIYLADGVQAAQQFASLKQALAHLKECDTGQRWGRLTYEETRVREEDWANAWKAYYAPMHITERLVICPSWESYSGSPGETVIRLDPGMAFGTGGHDSTRLCLQLLASYLPAQANVLDMGCGSGILSVAALMLGAERATGVDIDEVAVRVAKENAEINGVAEKAQFFCGNLADRVDKSSRYQLIFANIVADVILSFLPDMQNLLDEDGVFITSGIIDTREQDVQSALQASGFTVIQRLESGGWIGLCCRRDHA